MKQKKGVPKDFSLADASKTGTLTEYAFFDKVRFATTVLINCNCHFGLKPHIINVVPLIYLI